MNRICLALAALLAFGCGSAPESEAPAAPEGRVEMERRIIQPEGFAAGSPFSPGVMAGETLYIAGQVGRDPATGEHPESIADQTRNAMNGVGAVLEAAGLTFSHLVSCHVQLTDMDDYTAMNEVYGGFYEEGKYPARTTLEMAGLVGGAEIEVSCIAYADAENIRIVRPDPAVIPPAMGPYSPAVMAGGTLYLSGTGGRDPKTGNLPEAAESQAALALQSINEILKAAELTYESVVTANVYYPAASDLPAIDKPLGAAFGAGAAPTRTAVELSGLPGDIKVEITFQAAADRYSITRLFMPGVEPGSLTTPAVLAGDTAYLGAVSARDAGNSVEAQFRAVIERLQARLALADMTLANVVNANVYLTDVGDFDAMNAVFREFFPANPPARTTVGVNGDAKVALALVAVR